MARAQPALRPLPVLSSPESYNPNTFDYGCPEPGHPTLLDWIRVFHKSTPTFVAHAAKDTSVANAQEAAKLFEAAFTGCLDELAAAPELPLTGHPEDHPIGCIQLCTIRERCLRAAGFYDVFANVKAQENASALTLLPSVLASLDALDATEARLEQVLRGVFAGNLFDLGSSHSAEKFAGGGGGSSAFFDTCASLLPRPWAVDDMDAAVAALSKGCKHVVMFVDNAGSDIVLGMLPLARELLKGGAQVTIAANELPSINDITITELLPLLEAAALVDAHVLRPALASGQLRAMSSGNGNPVIDLRYISEDLCKLVEQGCDLVILEGMGRGIETNLNARFSCASLKLGMIKHPEVALCLGGAGGSKGQLYDCVCKFELGCKPV